MYMVFVMIKKKLYLRQQFDSVALWRMKRETDSFMPITRNNRCEFVHVTYVHQIKSIMVE